MAVKRWNRRTQYLQFNDTVPLNPQRMLPLWQDNDPPSPTGTYLRMFFDVCISITFPVQSPAPPDGWASRMSFWVWAGVEGGTSDTSLIGDGGLLPDPRVNLTGMLKMRAITPTDAGSTKEVQFVNEYPLESEGQRKTPHPGTTPIGKMYARIESPDGVGDALFGYTSQWSVTTYGRALVIP